MTKKDLFAEVDEVQSIATTNTVVKDKLEIARPDQASPEWNDFVLSLFEADELIDGMPLAAGLRRVAELLYGPIASSTPVQVFPSNDGSHRATVVWRIEFERGGIFGDVADVNQDNTDDMFLPFAVATAATRAEARALRKALRLKKCAAEEITKKDTAALARKPEPTKSSDGEYADAARMTDNQSGFIDAKLTQLNIDGAKFFSELYNINSKGKITKAQASTAIEKLNLYQQKSGGIPKSQIGYKKDWRN